MRRVTTIRVCDVCTAESQQPDRVTVEGRTVELVVDGRKTVVDLCGRHRDLLAEATAPYVRAGDTHRTKRKRRRRDPVTGELVD